MDEEKNKLDAFCEQSLKNVSNFLVFSFFILLFLSSSFANVNVE